MVKVKARWMSEKESDSFNLKQMDPNAKQVHDFDTELDLAKFMGVVHSPIKDNVSADFVLSRPDGKDREFMIEMMNNAYYADNLMQGLIIAANRKVFERKQHRARDVVSIQTLEKHLKLLEKSKTMLFTSFTSKSQLLAIMTRNVSENHIAKILAKIKDDADIQITSESNMLEQLKNKLRPEQVQ